MKANTYQKWTRSTMIYSADNELAYLTLGLNGEAGEVAEKTKKIIRDMSGSVPYQKAFEIYQELGDVLWYVARLADFWGISLEDVMKLNKAKLMKRKKEGKLHGNGDNR